MQGWKLHISSIPIEAEALLDRVAGTLRDSGVAFKVAASLSIIEALNDGRLGPTQIGKFMTIYPEPDVLLPLANALAGITAGFVGPAIPTDRRLGDVLYTRYGNFVQQRHVDRLGLSHRVLTWPDGSWMEDTYHVPFQAPDRVADPFIDWVSKPVEPSGIAEKKKLFGPGYLIVDVLHESVHGACFLALDMRTRESVLPVVLKQARHHTMSDRFGRDARSRLQREYHIMRELDGLPAVVSIRDRFALGDSSYLVLEYREGLDFETTVNQMLDHKQWVEATKAHRSSLLRYLLDLASCLRDLHLAGFVHRDLNNTNVRIGPDGEVFLLDFEMAHRLGHLEPVIGAGTAGFNSPQQRAGVPPATTDDIFSFGCLAMLALTGIDPRRFSGNVPCRADRILALTGPAPELARIFELVASALSYEAAERPDIETLIMEFGIAQATLEAHLGPPHTNETAGLAQTERPDLAPVIESAVTGLLHDVPQTDDGLWRTLPFGGGDQGVVDADLELQRSAHSGIAGPTYVLSLAAENGFGDRAALRQRLSRAADWLTSDGKSDDADLPGLHFGRAGVALALSTLHRAGLGPALPNAQLRAWMSGSFDWPDVTHGAAGQGLAALSIAPEYADRAAEYLCERQELDGAWAVPQGVGMVSGQKLTGFAHGAAGIVYFLCLHARMRSDEQARAAAERGIAWLESVKQNGEGGGTPEWPYSDHVETPWRWWCHGGPGIALAYLAAYETFGETSLLKTATGALAAHHPLHIRYGNLSYCHGLVGLGEIYLEALRVTGDDVWQVRVNAILTSILALARTGGQGTTWLVEDPAIPTADLGLGISGVLHLLLRCQLGPEVIGLPLCPAPAIIASDAQEMNGL